MRVRYAATMSADSPADAAFRSPPQLAALSYPALWPVPHGMGELRVWVDGAAGTQQGTRAWTDAGAEAAAATAAAADAAPPPLLIVPLNLDVLLQNNIVCESPSAALEAQPLCSTGEVSPPPPPTPPPPPPPPPPGTNVTLSPALCCPPGTAWVGITASTGAALAAWEVLSWAFWSDAVGAAPVVPGAV